MATAQHVLVLVPIIGQGMKKAGREQQGEEKGMGSRERGSIRGGEERSAKLGIASACGDEAEKIPARRGRVGALLLATQTA
eukprot:275731-Chlamydomonas_euryale.AAC.1